MKDYFVLTFVEVCDVQISTPKKAKLQILHLLLSC